MKNKTLKGMMILSSAVLRVESFMHSANPLYRKIQLGLHQSCLGMEGATIAVRAGCAGYVLVYYGWESAFDNNFEAFLAIERLNNVKETGL